MVPHHSQHAQCMPNVFLFLIMYHLMFCRAEAVYQSMKSVYGTHACHMLQINSVSNTGSNPLPNLPDPWSQFIIPASDDTLVSVFILPPVAWPIVSVALHKTKWSMWQLQT